MTSLDLYNCNLTNLDITGLSSLQHFDVSNNRFTQQTVDHILTAFNSFGTYPDFSWATHAEITLRGPLMSLPSSVGLSARMELSARGWPIHDNVPIFFNMLFVDNNTIVTEASEGTSLYCVVNITNTEVGVEVPYSITGISEQDIDIPLNGIVTTHPEGMGAGAVIYFTLTNDMLTEGPETMVVTFGNSLSAVTATGSLLIVE
jgi:hypothetical protein